MKRILSMVLTLAMILSLIPAVFAAGEEAQTYNLYSGAISGGSQLLSNVKDYGDTSKTWGWKHFGYSEGVKESSSSSDKYLGYVSSSNNGLMFNLYKRSDGQDHLTFALSLEAPSVSGFYIPSTYWNAQTSNATMTAYVGKGDDKTTVDDYAKSENLIFTVAASSTGFYTSSSTKAIYTTGTDELIAAYDLENFSYKFFNIKLTPIIDPTMTISVDETMTASVTVSGKASFYNEETSSYNEPIDVSMPVSNSFITYSSDNAGVAAIDPKTGVITPGGGYGTAIISAETSGGVKCSVEYKVEEPEPEEPEKPGEEVTDTDKSVSVMPENENEGTVTGLDNVVDEVPMGTTINPIATPADGYKFAYWKDSSGTVLSTNPSETFVINTNTAIKAVFDKITEESSDKTTVELYNANGMLFHKNENVALNTSFADVAAAAGTPSLVGYVFKHWSMYANEAKIENTMPITALTRAVAIYEEPEAQYTVRVDGADVIANKKYKYGEEVTVTAQNTDFSCWKLGDKIVSYKPSYTFSVWGNVDLTEATDAVTEAPVATLVKDGENHLLIYSVPENYTKIEAGIIFSNNNSITVDAFDGKKTSEVRGTGQFMVSSDFTYARGYLIFKNNTSGEIRILYAE